jgi:hypothetical protein
MRPAVSFYVFVFTKDVQVIIYLVCSLRGLKKQLENLTANGRQYD